MSDHYTYQVFWSEEDGEFAGTCSEFPALSWLDKNRMKAFTGIVRLVGEVVSDMKAEGEILPPGITQKKPRKAIRVKKAIA
jgi:hypothetical protein